MKQKIFRWNRTLHRDLGYLTLGLTLIFAVSGIVLNHQDQWNPSYDIDVSKMRVQSVPQNWDDNEIVPFLKKIGIQKKYQSFYFSSPDEIKIFVENGSIAVDLQTSQVVIERVTPRPILREWVLLHRNKSNLSWTLISDFYAALLLFLGVGGLFMVKGRNGLKWRATAIATFGFLISMAFMFF